MINGKITKIKNKNEEVLFPITTSQAVLMSDGLTSVEDALSNINVTTDAEGTSFDNSTNGMEATNVQSAIEEVNNKISSITVSTDAKNTAFDNSNNSMSATNVQDAIEENKTKIATVQSSVNEINNNIATLNSGVSSLNTKTDNTNTSLNQLTTTVNNGQRHKLTDNSGYCINVGSVDCNTLKTTGKYMGSNMINAPISGQWFFIDVTAHNNIWCEQIATAFAYDQSKYIRYQLNGTWQPWRSL